MVPHRSFGTRSGRARVFVARTTGLLGGCLLVLAGGVGPAVAQESGTPAARASAPRAIQTTGSWGVRSKAPRPMSGLGGVRAAFPHTNRVPSRIQDEREGGFVAFPPVKPGTTTRVLRLPTTNLVSVGAGLDVTGVATPGAEAGAGPDARTEPERAGLDELSRALSRGQRFDRPVVVGTGVGGDLGLVIAGGRVRYVVIRDEQPTLVSDPLLELYPPDGRRPAPGVTTTFATPSTLRLSPAELAGLLMQSGRYGESATALGLHLEDQPDDALAVRSMGLAMLLDRRDREGVGLIAMAYRRDPGLFARPIDAGVLRSGGDLRRAVARAVAFANRENSGSAWLAVAALMQAQGRVRLAWEMTERARAAGLEPELARAMDRALGVPPSGPPGASEPGTIRDDRTTPQPADQSNDRPVDPAPDAAG